MNLHPAFPYPLYLVISKEACTFVPFLILAEEAIKGGVDIVQLREKNCTNATFLDTALALKEITDKYNVPLIINDNLEVATKVDAYGVHVGNSDMPPSQIADIWPQRPIGYSIEYLSQLESEEIKFANHLGISPVFSTPTKKNTVTEWGISGIKNLRKLTSKPLIGIGNMNASNLKEVLDAGANSVAVVSAICGAKDPYKEASLLKRIILNENI